MNTRQENAAMKNSEKSPGKGLNILMVDDDEICLFIQRRVLELSGQCSTIQSALNGKIAMELLQRAVSDAQPLPDIILLDLQMPVMNGAQFMEAFRCMDFPCKERIVIVLLTSSVWESDKEYAFSLGVSHYLNKPFTVDGFHALLCSLYNKPTSIPATTTALHPQENKNFRNLLS
jgi:CheY-like chemotaxis protein